MSQATTPHTAPPGPGRLPWRTALAAGLARSAGTLSRITGRGDGSVIGGRVGLLVDPELLANLAAGRTVVLVSGTNGKTTTTRLTAAGLGAHGPVATNSLGANMPSGHTSALARAGDTRHAVLEVDEHYLPQVLVATGPAVVALLNLSRDQLDRAMEVAMLAAKWREAVAAHPGVHVVANADDPMVVYAAEPAAAPDRAGVTWVGAGQRWQDDSWACPRCNGAIVRDADHWWCAGCPLRRPGPDWVAGPDTVTGPDGRPHRVALALPGRVNVGNAATALAVAARLGVAPEAALPRLSGVTTVAGRYAQVERDGRRIRLLLAKNPASWLEAFEMAAHAPTLLAVNARGPDGLDTSWLFDVDFSPLADGRPVLVAGDRAYDLAVRLSVNGVPFAHVPDFAAGLAAVPPGPLEVIANYTAFQDIRAELDRVL